MSTEIEPTLQTQPLDDRLMADDTLNDPEIQAIMDEFDAQVAALSDDLDALPALLELPEPGIHPVTQETIDEIASEILGRDVDEVKILAKNLDETTKMDKKTSGTILESTLFQILIEQDNPLVGRSAQRSIARQRPLVQTLVDFWQSESAQSTTSRLTAERDEALKSRLVDPINEVLGERDPEETKDSASYLAEIQQRLASGDQIDDRLDLSALKFAIISDIARIFHDTEIHKPFVKNLLGHLTVEQDEMVGDMIRSDLSGSLMTAKFLRDIRTGPAQVEDTLMVITGQHRKDRLFSVPKRSFSAKINQLYERARMYDAILGVESLLEGSQITLDTMESDLQHAAEMQATEAGYKIADLLNATYNKIASRSNELIKASLDDMPARSVVWRTAHTLDTYRIEKGQQLVDKLRGSGIPITDAVLDELRTELTPRVETQISTLNEQHELARLEPEISEREQEFEAIDSDYELSASALRKLCPEAISLAKHLADHLPNEADPLDKDSARAVVALMLGAHQIKKNNGQKLDIQQVVSEYLADAATLQTLTQELAFLGQAKESTLLTTINLLNELIDAGTFDNPSLPEELKIFDEFLLEYMDATTRPEQTEIEPTAEEADTATDPLTLPEVPTETLRQAEYEDLKVFPPGATDTEIIEDFVRGIAESEMPQIEWERITRLVQLRDQLAKQSIEVSLIRTQHASWQVLPFFVLEAKLPDTEKSTVIVESPVYGNATYIYRESSQRQPWREVIQQSRQEARKAGAVALVHVDSKRLDNHFQKVWNRLISELTIYQ